MVLCNPDYKHVCSSSNEAGKLGRSGWEGWWRLRRPLSLLIPTVKMKETWNTTRRMGTLNDTCQTVLETGFIVFFLFWEIVKCLRENWCHLKSSYLIKPQMQKSLFTQRCTLWCSPPKAIPQPYGTSIDTSAGSPFYFLADGCILESAAGKRGENERKC